MIHSNDLVAKDEGTPDAIFEALDAIFHFTADACARVPSDACGGLKCWDDSLHVRWTGERGYANPPAGREGDWVYKAIYETEVQPEPAELVVVVVPANLDTMGMITMHATRKVMPPIGQFAVLDKEGNPCHAVIAVFEK